MKRERERSGAPSGGDATSTNNSQCLVAERLGGGPANQKSGSGVRHLDLTRVLDVRSSATGEGETGLVGAAMIFMLSLLGTGPCRSSTELGQEQ